mmetsp:Transcript_13105/g.35685  ORF Transcript_13105/g.35685 Transcript_13105/m.35685 type:complete len:123 (+) Transcript_13105:1128-1496(+)
MLIACSLPSAEIGRSWSLVPCGKAESACRRMISFRVGAPSLASKVLGVAGWMVALDACALVRTLKEEGTCKRANLCEWAATAVHAHGFPDSIFFFYYKLVLQLQLSYSASLWWIENSTSQVK